MCLRTPGTPASLVMCWLVELRVVVVVVIDVGVVAVTVVMVIVTPPWTIVCVEDLWYDSRQSLLGSRSMICVEDVTRSRALHACWRGCLLWARGDKKYWASVGLTRRES